MDFQQEEYKLLVSGWRRLRDKMGEENARDVILERRHQTGLCCQQLAILEFTVLGADFYDFRTFIGGR